jgi:hypothetical protein
VNRKNDYGFVVKHSMYFSKTASARAMGNKVIQPVECEYHQVEGFITKLG